MKKENINKEEKSKFVFFNDLTFPFGPYKGTMIRDCTDTAYIMEAMNSNVFIGRIDKKLREKAMELGLMAVEKTYRNRRYKLEFSTSKQIQK